MREAAMKRTELWLLCVLASVYVLACAGCESTTMVGSECRHGVCPQASAATSLACVASTSVSEIAVTRLPYEDPTDPEAYVSSICLPRLLPIDADGHVACTMTWEVNPDPSAYDVDDEGNIVPVDLGPLWDGSCDDPYLAPAGPGDPPDACVVQQVSAAEAAAGSADGFYMSSDLFDTCGGAGVGLTYTRAANVPSGVVVKVACARTQSVGTDGELFDVDPSECGRPPAGIGTDVGAACLPPLPDDDGFDDREVYLETFSQQCESGACMVFRLLGDPTTDCDEGADLARGRCADPSEVDKRAYCSCRCRVPEGEDAEPCTCPDGFTCVDDVLTEPPSLAGGYCLHDGTFNPQ
jgi:hypothetical protein